jgi:hypothetical protein
LGEVEWMLELPLIRGSLLLHRFCHKAAGPNDLDLSLKRRLDVNWFKIFTS